MKKRIIAILLALSVLVTSLGNSKRASADPATVAVVGFVCIAAVSVLQFVTSGAYQEAADALVSAIEYTGESFKYVFYGTDVTDMNGNVIYHEDGPFLTGVSQIANKLQIAYDKGELEYVGGDAAAKAGQFKIKGSHYRKLVSDLNGVIGVMSRPNIDFTAGYNCTFLDVDLSKPFSLESLPTISEFFLSRSGESYAAVYFDDSRIIFSQYYLKFRRAGAISESGTTELSVYRQNSNFTGYDGLQGSVTNGSGTLGEFYSNFKYTFSMPNLNKLAVSRMLSSSQQFFENTVDHCFVYENGSITYTPISDVDVTGMSSGLVTTTGDYGAFLKSIDDYSVSTTTVPKLDDLSGVVPDDATLSIPINPDKEVALPDQIGVSIPNVGEYTLAELQGDVNIDIDVPSIIVDKFPFCIPFDFMRFLGLLCSDPVAPVFRIPISTHPDNLEQWEGNQTIGDYINPDSPPLFDIDEEIVIDLSVIPLVQPICYTCFIVGFVFLLLHITTKMIQH